jgi:hypothetical protein
MTLLVSAPVSEAQRRFSLPVEVSQGFVARPGETTPYTASIRALPTFALGRNRLLRVGAVAAVTDFNPDWTALGGARIAYRVVAVPKLNELGIDLSLESQWGSGRRPVAVAVTADASGLFRLSLSVARELDEHETLWGLGVGADPLALGPLIAGSRIEEEVVEDREREPEPGECEPRDDYYDVLCLTARVAALVIFEADVELRARAEDRLKTPPTGLSDPTRLKQWLVDHGLGTLADSLDGIVEKADARARFVGMQVPTTRDGRDVEALLKGWREALREE